MTSCTNFIKGAKKIAKLRPQDLDKIARTIKNADKSAVKAKIIVHMGTCGIAAGAEAVRSELAEEIKKRQLKNVILKTSSCAGLCSREPMVTVKLQGRLPVKYVDVTPEKALRILESHVLAGTIPTEYALAEGYENVL